MPKKVFELAKEMDIGAVDLVDKLKAMGFDVKNHMVTLQDDEVAKAMAELAPKSADKAKKKVIKKKVAKKKVVKKSTSKSASEPEELKASDDSSEEGTKVVKKKKVIKITSAEKAARKESALYEEKPAHRFTEIAPAPSAPKEETEQIAAKQEAAPSKAMYEEKMHAFTPVFVPEAKSKEESSDSDARKKDVYKSSATSPAKSAPVSGTPVVDDAGTKKRMGDLAAIVSKKGVAPKKDMTQIRADEEMKLATTILGRGLYTQVKRKKIFSGSTKKTELTEVKDSKRVVVMFNVITAADLAQKLSERFDKFQNKCLELSLLVKKEDYIGIKLATEIADIYDYRIENRAFNEDEVLGKEEEEDKSHLPHRNSIITVMGHVDHGKTTLLDCLRKTKVTDGEAGGITQHIGAYSVNVGDSTLTFLDTPGHAAFGSMRQRGADVTDIVILVVAADDGVMPQTKESIKYAKKAGSPIIVAINKMDKEGANPDRIMQELTEFELVSEAWGGDTMFCPISALNGDGIDELLESIKLQAEMMDLREDPTGNVEGVVIESRIESGRGPVSTILVQKGTLKKGDALVCGECFGRARTLMDHTGKIIPSAGPSIPVQVLGFDTAPSPGDIINVVKNEREAKKVVENRITERKKLESAEAPKVASLEDFFANSDVSSGEKKVLNLIIRTDVQGSFEAIKEALNSIGTTEVAVDIIAGGVGAITDGDVSLAANTNGYIIGFNMRPVTSARKMAEEKGVDIKTYSIIYKLIDEVTLALEGMLEPEKVEKYIGRAEVKETFSVPKIGTIAGCGVIDGKIERGCNIRLLREGKIMFDGKLSTLKRFKDEVKEVANGYECGMALEGYGDIKSNDLIEAYILEEKKRTLEESASL